MKRILLVIAIVLALLVLGFYALNSYIYTEKQGDGLPEDFKEALFSISGEPVDLQEGIGKVRIPSEGNIETTVRYFGNDISHDVDGDGEEDVVFLVTRETNSGIWYYVVAALKRGDGYEGSKAVLIGIDIAPQTLEKGEERTVIVNYAVRMGGESVGKSIYLLLDPKTLEFGELVQNFEGEER